MLCRISAAMGIAFAVACGRVEYSPEFTPKNVGDRIAVDAGTAPLALEDPDHPFVLLNTDDGSITAYDGLEDLDSARSERIRPAMEGDHGGVLFRPLPVEGLPSGIGVFAVRSLDIPEGMTVIGTGSRPLVILAAEQMTIAGTLTVGADRVPAKPGPGPGGFGGADGERADGSGPGGGHFGLYDTYDYGGGGGASYGGMGGNGSLGLGEPGMTYGSPGLEPLVGGSGGGDGGGVGGRGGAGGGALQLVAADAVHVEVSGRIDAGGGGGKGGRKTTNRRGAGGGGGSGGAILVQAPQVIVEGFIGANGGAGGQGCTGDEDGQEGTVGRADRVPAPGTSASGPTGGGGDGSDVGGTGEDGRRPSTEWPAQGGGGGGGAGRIRIETVDAVGMFDRGITPDQDSGRFTVGALGEAQDA